MLQPCHEDVSFLQPNSDVNSLIDEYQFPEQIYEQDEESIESSYMEYYSLSNDTVDEENTSNISKLVYSSNQIVFPCQDEATENFQSIDIQLILSSSTLIHLLQSLSMLSDLIDCKVAIVANRKLLSLDWLVDIPIESYYSSFILGIINGYSNKLVFAGDVLSFQKLMRRCKDFATIGFDKNKISVTDINNLTKFSDIICQFSDNKIQQLPIGNPIIPRAKIDKRINKLANEVPEEKLKIVKLVLTQREVSSLIGVKGHRLNSIRIQSRCLIKVVPINQETLTLIPSRRENPQEIFIQGTPSNVSIAVHEINSFVSQQRLNNNKFR
ncbi:hypothetical protein JA1_003246 [Spathaspora sp. JA1]|nr:hypothetical protein JA1_003246 [Spathaspora sp. JA1]